MQEITKRTSGIILDRAKRTAWATQDLGQTGFYRVKKADRITHTKDQEGRQD
jgi:hypothetical protein